MEISFSKKADDKSIIACKRKDGTSTWMHSDPFFILHDICHYAVETVLNLKNSFYGMLASGIDINDFELPKEMRTVEFTPEAIWTEQFVNLLAIEHRQGEVDTFIDTLKEISAKNNIIGIQINLDNSQLNQVRSLSKKLVEDWQLLPVGKTITLNFEE